jgi:tRNA (mo5U34)-methyltransferase
MEGHVASRTVRWRDYALTVEVPSRVAARIRRLQGAPVSRPTLEFIPELPPLDVVRRDPVAALDSGDPPDEEPTPAPAASAAASDGDVAALAREVADVYAWYHTLELPGGVVTPGVYDHRPLVPHYPFPADLAGRTVLDVATFDGFWAFEFEKRGADVTAVDIARWSEMDHPHGVRDVRLATGRDAETGGGFRLASRALGSKVRRITSSVYDLNPQAIGTYELVHMSDLLLHLRDPLRALEAVRSVTAEGGAAILTDSINRELPATPGRFVTEYFGGWRNTIWWLPTLDTLAQMVLDAGFSDVRLHRIYRLDLSHTGGAWRAILLATP